MMTTIQPDLLMLEEAKPERERNRQGESHVSLRRE